MGCDDVALDGTEVGPFPLTFAIRIEKIEKYIRRNTALSQWIPVGQIQLCSVFFGVVVSTTLPRAAVQQFGTVSIS